MFEELSVVKMASAMARHATARHRVISENVANADTPGYKARDVKGFAEYVKEPFTARATLPGHVTQSGFQTAALRPEVFIDTSSQASGNGNSVSIESEIVKSAAAQGQHAMASAIYSKARDLLRLSLGNGR